MQLHSGSLIPLAFHVWEGSNGETGLKMSLSSWTFLDLHEPTGISIYLVIILIVLIAALLEFKVIFWLRHRAVSGKSAGEGLSSMINKG